jgi:hypothetical protein
VRQVCELAPKLSAKIVDYRLRTSSLVRRPVTQN